MSRIRDIYVCYTDPYIIIMNHLFKNGIICMIDLKEKTVITENFTEIEFDDHKYTICMEYDIQKIILLLYKHGNGINKYIQYTGFIKLYDNRHSLYVQDGKIINVYTDPVNRSLSYVSIIKHEGIDNDIVITSSGNITITCGQYVYDDTNAPYLTHINKWLENIKLPELSPRVSYFISKSINGIHQGYLAKIPDKIIAMLQQEKFN